MLRHPIEYVGGMTRCMTLLTIVLHFLHPLFSVATYCHWVRYQRGRLGGSLVDAYLALTVLSCVAYLFASSVFYMWAWRYPEPEELAKRRRIYGIVVNLALCDVPLFVVEVKVVWRVGLADGMQGFNVCLTCVSFAYSTLRVWTLFLARAIKRQQQMQHQLAAYHMPLPPPPHANMPSEDEPARHRRGAARYVVGDADNGVYSDADDAHSDSATWLRE